MKGVDLNKYTVSDIKLLLSLNFRIAVYLKSIQVGTKETAGIGETIEYHFVRDKQDKDGLVDMNVNCVLCKSKIGDSLKLCGLKKLFSELKCIFELPKLSGNYVLYFERIRVEVFPFDWYPCFETSDKNNLRWKEIEDTIKMLPMLTAEFCNMEEIQKKQRRDKEDAEKREKEEEERKKREEENKKREESRKRMEELAKSLEVVANSDNNPENFLKFMKDSMKK